MLQASTFPTRKSETPKATLAEQAYEYLQHDLLAGVFAPGEKMQPQVLQERYGLGTSPIREALMLLSRDGLVRNQGQRGFRVAEASRDDLLDIIHARKQIETELLRDAIRCGDEDWGAQIAATFYKLVHTPVPSPDDMEGAHRWEAAHRQFHFALLGAARSKWLRRLDEQLVLHSERYRRMRLHDGQPITAMESNIDRSHRELMEAVLNRDAEHACALLASHIEETAKIVEPHLP